MSEEKKKKYGYLAKITGVIIGLVLVLGVSYAVFRMTSRGEKINRINTADFDVVITDESEEAIVLENAVPITDEEGLKQKAYTFKVKNNGTVTARYSLTLEVENTTTLPNTVVKYNLVEDKEEVTIDPITLTNETQEEGKTLYKIDTDVILPNTSKSYSLQLWVDYEATTEEASGKNFEARVRVDAEQFTKESNPYKEGTLAYKIVDTNKVIEEVTTKEMGAFDLTKDDSGLYSYEDLNGGKTYYYRGFVLNNYISFAGETWRIVRVLEDGSVRLILENHIGTHASSYNSPNTSIESLNYKGSSIETTVNTWYNNSLNKYDKYIKTSTYCNDKRENNNNAWAKMLLKDENVKNVFGIHTRGRLDETFDVTIDHTDEELEAFYDTIKFTPDLSCEESDKVNAKIALLTADEYVLAGGFPKFNKNSTTYLAAPYWWWTMSPVLFGSQANVAVISQEGELSDDHVENSTDPFVRPVITLKASMTITSGSGSASNPYKIG